MQETQAILQDECSMMNLPKLSLELTSVYDNSNRHEILFKLLSERDESINVHHKNLPDWGSHVAFVESRPYEAWYIIGDNFGACYLTKRDEIGIFIFKDHQDKGYGRKAVETLMEKHGQRNYLANINPHNHRSIAFFSGLGFNLIQETYARRG